MNFLNMKLFKILLFSRVMMINSNFSKIDVCISTQGGTANGANCVFPFIYGGTEYNQCTDDEYIFHNDWCATTDNYDIDKKWGHCVIKSNEYQFHPRDGASPAKEGAVCKFPFQFDGKTYEECILAGVNSLWCGIDDHGTWGYCDRSCNNTATTTTGILTATTPPPSTTSTTPTPTTATTPTSPTSSTPPTPTTATTPTSPTSNTPPMPTTTTTLKTTTTDIVLVATTPASQSSKEAGRTTAQSGVLQDSEVNSGTITTTIIGLVSGLSVCMVVILIGIGAGVTLFIIYRKKQRNAVERPTADTSAYYNVSAATRLHPHNTAPKIPRRNPHAESTASYEQIALAGDYYNVSQVLDGSKVGDTIYELPQRDGNEIAESSNTGNVYQPLENAAAGSDPQTTAVDYEHVDISSDYLTTVY